MKNHPQKVNFGCEEYYEIRKQRALMALFSKTKIFNLFL